MFATLLSPIIPNWNHLHPLVVHFPVALLMVAPLFVLGGLFMDVRKVRPYFMAALFLMLLGTCGTFLAGATGDAASEVANKTPAIRAVLEKHEEMADTTEVIFGVLTAGFAAFVFLPGLLRRELPIPVARAVVALFLVLYLGGMGVLASTAHDGGRLVHELGIHGGVGPTGAATTVAAHSETDRE